MDKISDTETMKSMTALDMFGGPGGSHGGTRNIYLDATWEHIPKDLKTKFKSVRCNERSNQHVQLLSNSKTGMENFYIVNTKCPVVHGDGNGTSALTPPGSAPPSQEEVALGKQYIYALTRHHGASLKRLLLSDQWNLTSDEIGDLVRFCPNLEQLGIAIQSTQRNVLRLLIPFLPKVTAVRLLLNDSLHEHLKHVSREERMAGMGRDLWKAGVQQLKWVGLGDQIYRIGKTYSVPLEDGSQEWRREVAEATSDDVKDIEIWRMDSLDLDADPIAPFDP